MAKKSYGRMKMLSLEKIVQDQYPLKKQNEIVHKDYERSEIADVSLNGEQVFFGNYSDCYAGGWDSPLHWFLDRKYGEYKTPKGFVSKLKEYILDNDKAVKVVERIYKKRNCPEQ